MSPHYGEIKIGAEILGLDGKAGRVRQILIVPAGRQVVGLVVDRGVLRPNVVVPVEAITAANEDEVEIRLAEAELSRLPAFREQMTSAKWRKTRVVRRAGQVPKTRAVPLISMPFPSMPITQRSSRMRAG